MSYRKWNQSNLERVCFHFLHLHSLIGSQMLYLCTQSESFGSHLIIEMTESTIVISTKKNRHVGMAVSKINEEGKLTAIFKQCRDGNM